MTGITATYRCYLPVLAGFVADAIKRPGLHRPARNRVLPLPSVLNMLFNPALGGFRVTEDRQPSI